MIFPFSLFLCVLAFKLIDLLNTNKNIPFPNIRIDKHYIGKQYENKSSHWKYSYQQRNDKYMIHGNTK